MRAETEKALADAIETWSFVVAPAAAIGLFWFLMCAGIALVAWVEK